MVKENDIDLSIDSMKRAKAYLLPLLKKKGVNIYAQHQFIYLYYKENPSASVADCHRYLTTLFLGFSKNGIYNTVSLFRRCGVTF